MRTEQRLTEAYKNAKVECFDENSKYVFFSDCHRGTGNLSDEFTKHQSTYLHALKYYYNHEFVYIEAGDGDELWEHKQFKDIKTAHYFEFEVLKQFHEKDRLIMLYGNHNIYLKDPKYVRENYYTYYNEYQQVTYDFLRGIVPCEALVLKYKKNGQELMTIHGHQGDFPNDQMWKATMISVKYFWRYLHAVGINNPSSPVKNENKQHRIERNFNKWIDSHKKAIICGHTHRFKYPRKGETPYFNIGCCVYPTSITAIEITEGMIQIVRWRVVVNKDGFLHVVRHVLRGPDPIESFDNR